MLFTSMVAGFKVMADTYKCKCMHVSVCVPSRRTNTRPRWYPCKTKIREENVELVKII